jgi:hypothetical protein
MKISMKHRWNETLRGNGSRPNGEKPVALPLRGNTFVIIMGTERRANTEFTE